MRSGTAKFDGLQIVRHGVEVVGVGCGALRLEVGTCGCSEDLEGPDLKAVPQNSHVATSVVPIQLPYSAARAPQSAAWANKAGSSRRWPCDSKRMLHDDLIMWPASPPALPRSGCTKPKG